MDGASVTGRHIAERIGELGGRLAKPVGRTRAVSLEQMDLGLHQRG